MTRKQRIAVVIAGVIIVAIGISVALLNQERRSSSNLRWNIEVGDDFIYELESIYHQSDSGFNSTIFAQMSALNHTRVRMEVINLPNIPPMIDGDILSAEVINSVKTYCTFENGSELPAYYSDEINRLLSSCLLPTGDWDLLDWCFVDDVSNGFYPGIYVSELQMDHFMIAYELWPGDATIRWSANVTLENGTPQAAFTENDSFPVGTHTILRLTLAS